MILDPEIHEEAEEIADDLIEFLEGQTFCYGCIVTAMSIALGEVIANRCIAEDVTIHNVDQFSQQAISGVRNAALSHYAQFDCANDRPA